MAIGRSIRGGTQSRRCALAIAMSFPRQTPIATACGGRSSFPCAGNYAVWVRAVGLERQGKLRTSVGGKLLAVTHSKRPAIPHWELAGTIDLPAGETEIAVRGEGPRQQECDAVLLGPANTTLAGIEEVCALAQRLRRTPSPGQVAAVFDDGRRIEGSLVSGWRGSGMRIARDAVRPAVRCLAIDCLAAESAPQSDALLEFQNGDRMRGTLCGSAAAENEAGQNMGAGVRVQPSLELSKSAEEPIIVEPDWLRRVVFDVGPVRHCRPRSLVCRDGRVIAFRVLRFNDEGVSLLTDRGLVRIPYRELAEIAMQPMDVWEAYYRQLAQIDPDGNAEIVRLQTRQGMVLTASTTRAASFRKETEAVASSCLIRPAWSRTAVPVAWSSVHTVWRRRRRLFRSRCCRRCRSGREGLWAAVGRGKPIATWPAANSAATVSELSGVSASTPPTHWSSRCPTRAGLSQRRGDRLCNGRLWVHRGESLRKRPLHDSVAAHPAAFRLAHGRGDGRHSAGGRCRPPTTAGCGGRWRRSAQRRPAGHRRPCRLAGTDPRARRGKASRSRSEVSGRT